MKFKYEFLPFWLFYAPIVPVWAYYSLRSFAFTYFCNANPGIEWGGFYAYSKFKILKQLPKEFIPESVLIRLHDANNQNQLLSFPFVAKPDIGERGKQVEVIRNLEDWKSYVQDSNESILIQDFMHEPLEFGVFYVRLPNEKNGRILSITGKEFLCFKGDGKTTLKKFITTNTRAQKREEYLLEKFDNQLDSVLPKGETLILEEIGNHNRGTKFIDASYLITEDLTRSVDAISKNIAGFYYGRYDLKTNSIDDFKRGKFRVIELNGSNSEATHIYDPKHNIWFAYKEVLRHLNWQYKIAKQNRKNGHTWHSHFGLLKALLGTK